MIRRTVIRRTRIAIGVCALLLGLCACAPQDENIVWRFAIEETAGSVQDAYAQLFKEEIESLSQGEIEVKVFPYGTLGTSDQLTELLHNGTLEFAMASPGHIGKLIPEVQVLLLHYLFSPDEELNRRALNSPKVLQAFDELYALKGFKFLGVVSEGWQAWTANRPVRTPADFSGLKFRVMTSPLLLAAYSAYGASPTPLAYSEVYSALQLKMVDGQVNPVFAIEEMSFYEVSDFLIFAYESPFYTTVISNRDFYNGLDEQHRRWVDEAVAEVDDAIFEAQQKFNADRLEIIKQKRPALQIIELNAEEIATFREVSRAVRERFGDFAGPKGAELLELIESEIEKQLNAPEQSQP